MGNSSTNPEKEETDCFVYLVAYKCNEVIINTTIFDYDTKVVIPKEPHEMWYKFD